MLDTTNFDLLDGWQKADFWWRILLGKFNQSAPDSGGHFEPHTHAIDTVKNFRSNDWLTKELKKNQKKMENPPKR